MKTIKRSSLLYKSGVEYADFCINHVEGCSHGCRFPCYAMMMKKRCGVIKDYKDWITPKLVSNALELLEKEIPRYRDKIRFVHLCFTTDPFMYKYPEVEKLTLQIIQKLSAENIRSTVLTKGIYPKSLADQEKYGSQNEYGITLVSLSESFKKHFEPYTAPYKDRIKALKYLHDHGLRTWVSMEPYPTPNLVRQGLREILEQISFVDKVIFGKLNYNVQVPQIKYNDFYEQCAQEVIGFCSGRNMDYHIKFGTQKKNNNKTVKIFRERTFHAPAKEMGLALP